MPTTAGAERDPPETRSRELTSAHLRFAKDPSTGAVTCCPAGPKSEHDSDLGHRNCDHEGMGVMNS